MRRIPLLFVGLGLGVAPACAEVTVAVAPQREASQLVWRSAAERAGLIREIARLLETLGRRRLPPGRSLTVTVIDLRLAGRIAPSSASAIRVLSDVTPPSVRLRYVVKERGRVVAEGEENVTDLDYLSNVSARSSPSSYAYERELIRDWFRDRVVRLKPQPR